MRLRRFPRAYTRDLDVCVCSCEEIELQLKVLRKPTTEVAVAERLELSSKLKTLQVRRLARASLATLDWSWRPNSSVTTPYLPRTSS